MIDLSKVREELIQVAAVAVAIVQDIDNGIADANNPESISGIAGEIMNERDRQDSKFGPQHHTLPEWLMILGEEYGEACQAGCDSLWFDGKPKKGTGYPRDAVTRATELQAEDADPELHHHEVSHSHPFENLDHTHDQPKLDDNEKEDDE